MDEKFLPAIGSMMRRVYVEHRFVLLRSFWNGRCLLTRWRLSGRSRHIGNGNIFWDVRRLGHSFLGPDGTRLSAIPFPRSNNWRKIAVTLRTPNQREPGLFRLVAKCLYDDASLRVVLRLFNSVQHFVAIASRYIEGMGIFDSHQAPSIGLKAQPHFWLHLTG